MTKDIGNFGPMPGIFPDYSAPILRAQADGTLELAMARWGMPSGKRALFEAATKRADKLRAKGGLVDFAVECPLRGRHPMSGLGAKSNFAVRPPQLGPEWGPMRAITVRC